MARTANVIDVEAVKGQEPFTPEQEHNLQVMHEDASARAGEIAARFGDGLPYERERVVREAQFFMAQSAEAMLQAGKRLIELKENEPHGEYLKILGERIGLAPRTAQKMMQAALKFLAPTLEANAPTLAHLGKSKLFELMTQDDEELEALAEGGTVAGMSLDDVERMSASDLRKALRDAREQEDASNRMIRDKSERIDELQRKLCSPQARG